MRYLFFWKRDAVPLTANTTNADTLRQASNRYATAKEAQELAWERRSLALEALNNAIDLTQARLDACRQMHQALAKAETVPALEAKIAKLTSMRTFGRRHENAAASDEHKRRHAENASRANKLINYLQTRLNQVSACEESSTAQGIEPIGHLVAALDLALGNYNAARDQYARAKLDQRAKQDTYSYADANYRDAQAVYEEAEARLLELDPTIRLNDATALVEVDA